MARKSLKKPLVEKNWGKTDVGFEPWIGPEDRGPDVEAVNRLATSVPHPVVPKVDDHKVREDDLKRSVEHEIANAHFAAEALVVAGLADVAKEDLEKVALIAAVDAPGASGQVGPVTAAKIVAVLKGK